MYTQCSKCETVFKLSADVLRTAGGQVRCGRCGEVFNALSRLAEDANAFAGGESPLELETRADSILESVVAPQVAHAVARDAEELGPPGVEIARLQIIDWDLDEPDEPTYVEPAAPSPAAPSPAAPTPALPAPADELDDRAMEFTLPPGELDRIFVESKQHGLNPLIQPQSEPQPTTDHIPGEATPADSLLNPARPDLLRRPLVLWLSAAVISALLLVLQIVHQNREWFITHSQGPLGAVVGALYAVLGSPLPAPASLSAYELRQWGVTGDPDANGSLRLRASILNTAPQFQPYPLLRVTLADRFGKGIGRRDFEPAEYLGKPTAKMLAPGERVDATLQILDPGKSAEGFEIDVCLRGIDQTLSCANDVAPQSKR